MPKKSSAAQAPLEPATSAPPGARIAYARALRGVTQKMLAEKTGKARTTLAQYESDAIKPTVEAIREIAAALDVNPGFLAFGVGAVSNEATTHFGPSVRFEKGSQIAAELFPSKMGPITVSLGRLFERSAMLRLKDDAPALGLSAAEDILIVDRTVHEAHPDRRIYLLRSTMGLQPMRCEPTFGSGNELRFTGPDGQTYELPGSEINVEGVVLGSIKVPPAVLGFEDS